MVNIGRNDFNKSTFLNSEGISWRTIKGDPEGEKTTGVFMVCEFFNHLVDVLGVFESGGGGGGGCGVSAKTLYTHKIKQRRSLDCYVCFRHSFILILDGTWPKYTTLSFRVAERHVRPLLHIQTKHSGLDLQFIKHWCMFTEALSSWFSVLFCVDVEQRLANEIQNR